MKVILTAEEVRAGVARMAGEILAIYRDKPLTVVGVLTGSVVLLADIIRFLDTPLRVGFVNASSYRGAATERGPLRVDSELLPDISGRDVLLVDDIFDTGHTLRELVALMKELGPNSVRSAVLLRKRERCEVDVRPDFVAFDIPNEFVVGYGLDYLDAYRNLPYIATLEQNEIQSHH